MKFNCLSGILFICTNFYLLRGGNKKKDVSFVRRVSFYRHKCRPAFCGEYRFRKASLFFQGLIVGAPPIEWLHVLGLSQNSHQRQLIHKSAAKSNTESRTDRSGHFSTTGSPDENTCASVFLAQLLERFSRRTIPFHRRFLVLQSPANRAKTQGSLITTQIARGN